MTAIVALFAAIVSLFLQDGGEMFSNMFIDSSDLEKSNEETSLKMMSFGALEEEELDDNDTKRRDTEPKIAPFRHQHWQTRAFFGVRQKALFQSVTLVNAYRRNCAEVASRCKITRARRRERCRKTTPRRRQVKEDVEFWKHCRNGDIGVRLSPLNTFQRLVGNAVSGRQKETGDVPLQRPFHFESELFSGKCVFYFRNVPSAPEEVFNGKARKIQICIQGKFKEPVPIDDLMFGHSMIRPMVNLPSRWLLALATRVCQAFGAKYAMTLSSPSATRPFIRAPLILAAQAICVSKPGEEPDVTGAPIEDTSLLEYMPNDLGHAERRKYISKYLKQVKTAQSKKSSSASTEPVPEVPVYDTENVYTFCFWQ